MPRLSQTAPTQTPSRTAAGWCPAEASPKESPEMNALLIIDVQRGMFADPNNQPHDGEATAIIAHHNATLAMGFDAALKTAAEAEAAF